MSFSKFYNKIIHLPSIRDITMSDCNTCIYINYQNGDTRSDALQFATREDAEKAFAELCWILCPSVEVKSE